MPACKKVVCDVRAQRNGDPNDTVTINVGGQLFTTRRSTLYRLPHSRLYMIFYSDASTGGFYSSAAMQHEHTGGPHENPAVCGNGDRYVFFDRDPEIFKYILDYYRTGELHLPHSLCGPFIRKELIFWVIPEEDIEPCCLSLYMKYEEERKTKNMLFRDCFEDIEPMKHLVHISRGFKRWRYKSWLFLDFPTSSLGAKIWAVVLLLLMAVSIITYSLATHPDFRVERTFNKSWLQNSSAPSFIPKQCLNVSDKDNNKDYRYDCTIPLPSLIILDIVLNSIFTLEVLVKAVISPDRWRYLRSPTTILEICIFTSFWLQMLLTHVTMAKQDGETSGAIFLSIRTVIKINDDPESQENAVVQLLLAGCNMAQALRVFRIFKLSKISSGLRVLMLTVKKSITELVLLGFLLINGMFLFACLIYLAEYNVKDTFPSIPNALWWAIITITGVGYGDVFPKGGLGYFVGALCAISGCTVTGLAIPIIGHNFNTYYKYMRNYLKEGKYLRELRKERGTFDVDYHDRDRLAIIKRKLLHGRGVQHSASTCDRRHSDLAFPSSALADDKATTAGCTPVKRPHLLKRSLTESALPLPLNNNNSHLPHKTLLLKTEAVSDDCRSYVQPLRTPKLGRATLTYDRDRQFDVDQLQPDKSDLLTAANKDAQRSDRRFTVHCGDAEQQLLMNENRKSLRKIMGNSFDRGHKRPLT